MPYPTVFLIHTATLHHYTYTGAVNSNEERIPTTTDTTLSCRFSSAQESFRGNPAFMASTPRVVLPAGTVVSEGDTITSAMLGFDGTFRINSVKQVYEAAQAVVSHITCEIAAAGATGGV
jgi:hypothetical protein